MIHWTYLIPAVIAGYVICYLVMTWGVDQN